MNKIFAEAFVLLAYSLLGLTYLIKSRNKIFLLSTGSQASFTISYIIISAWSGFAMGLIGIARNFTLFMLNKKETKSKFWNNFTLGATFVAMIICSIFTFNGFLSLMSVIATGFYSIAIWNENGKFYKIFGIMASVCWIIYNIFIKLYLSVFFECVMVVCGIVGLIKARVEDKKIKIQEGD